MIKLKDPDEVLDYGFDWTGWLEGDTVTSSAWVVPAGLTRGNITFDNTSTTVWLSGGTAGARYTVINRIGTAAGRTVERSLEIVISANETP